MTRKRKSNTAFKSLRIIQRESFMREGFDVAIKAVEQDWIPVSERLPEDRELVLLSTVTDDVFEGRFFDDNTDCQWYAFRTDLFVPNRVVTAWMPMPKSYKADSEVKDV